MKLQPVVILQTIKYAGDTLKPSTGAHPTIAFLPPAAARALVERDPAQPIARWPSKEERRDMYRLGMVEKPAEATEKPSLAPAPVEPAETLEADSEVLSELEAMIDSDERKAVEDALESGRKADLISGLEAAGLNPDDYSNNKKRIAALRAWLEVA